ncbi:hypothetical protein BDV96DRAFT_489322 [Lophiotrema nucula]|uniref:FAD/NAD(P)-binding domain-containing protein n=1 Tax=Lophiotrema nucula TaxID=690887 RepID=A0A6A5ZF69_9PLEO|nr:hypothetical protein BDV96DRAFT_489322 [Lophiotrema nucula]
MKRVVIVGAGPCGLVGLKEMIAGGHDATLFEQSSTLGGVFASAAIYPNLHLTISNWAMAFSDFPDPRHLCYASAEEYLRYLQDYARHFDLEKYIMYNAEIQSVELSQGGKWVLEVKASRNHSNLHIDADALIVATGANQVPKELPSQLKGFTGRVLHSVDFNVSLKEEVREKNLRVLVVGGGESGADISSDLADITPHATVWLRRPICVGPRYLVSDPEMEQVEANKKLQFPANGFLEAATTNRMSAAQNVYVYGFFRRILWHTPILNRTLANVSLQSTASAFLMNDQATYVTKNQRMCEAWHNGRIEVLTCAKVSAHGHTVNFHTQTDNIEQREFDVVLLCTGFRTTFPWLKLPAFDTNPRSWYLHCFPKDFGHCLFFVGYARPHQGGIPAMAEILSRYISLVLRGDRKLPSNYADRARLRQDAEREHYHISPDLHTLVDYNAFLESVARRIGCEPRLPLSCVIAFNLHMLSVLAFSIDYFQPGWSVLGRMSAALLWLGSLLSFLLLHGGLLVKWWFYPHWSVWYRQRGPGSNAKLLNDLLRRVNLWKSTAITNGFVLLVLWSWPTYYFQRILSSLLFIAFSVLRILGLRFPRAWGGLLRPKMFSLHDAEWRVSDLFHP